MKGYIQVYTGNGKGKTTAALGLALRAAGAGLRVYIAQFVKGMKYSELKALDKLSESITIKQYGRDCFIFREPEKEIFKPRRKASRKSERSCALESIK
jgi:cob(I)alamin adenosyltransferase